MMLSSGAAPFFVDLQHFAIRLTDLRAVIARLDRAIQ